MTDSDPDLRNIYAEPSELARRKSIDHLDRHCRAFIELSPFLVIGSARGDGQQDVSPRGDAPGFVRVLDDRTLAIPDRIGNNRIDTLTNIAENPEVGLIFFVPGVGETLRVNGRARITLEDSLLESMRAQGKRPASALIVEVREAFLHCAKAIMRSKLWQEDYRVERNRLPSLGRMVAEQTGVITPEDADKRLEESYRDRLY